jgi:DNA-binding phage protein
MAVWLAAVRFRLGALSMDGNPQFSKLIKVLSEMGLRLAIEPDKQKSRATHR